MGGILPAAAPSGRIDGDETATAAPLGPLIAGDPAADAERRAGLRRMRTLATGLLVLAAVVYVADAGTADGFLGFVNAGAEASMVGAIADWFAVTALFKHPLGLPIPHTALIPQAQGRAGSRAGGVRGGELPPGGDHPGPDRRGRRSRGGWAAGSPSRRNAQRVVDEVAEVAAIALSKVRDEHIESLVRDAFTPRFREEPIAPLLGGLLDRGARATTCTTGWSTWPWTSCTAGWSRTRRRSPRCSASGRPGGRRRGSTRR